MPSFLDRLPTLDQRGKCAVAKADLRTRKQEQGKKDRTEAQVIKAVRAACVKRDGHCRIGLILGFVFLCSGPSEWAHLENARRGRTRGMAPERRHTTQGTAMMCQSHHQAYDAFTFALRMSALGADGPMFIICKGADGPFHVVPRQETV